MYGTGEAMSPVFTMVLNRLSPQSVPQRVDTEIAVTSDRTKRTKILGKERGEPEQIFYPISSNFFTDLTSGYSI